MSSLGTDRRTPASIRAQRVAFPLIFLVVGLALVRPCSGDTGVFNYTGNLNTARGAHTATLLPSGKVLAAAGFDGSTFIASAELYDPANGTWTLTGNLNTARDGHTATLLSNGKVLVAGGNGNNAPSSAELYDPVSGTWALTGDLNTGRYGHTATLLANGKVLVTGGGDASTELYDPASGTWTLTGNLNTARTYNTATLLNNGKVLVAGGYDPLGSLLTSAELYDPATGTWTTTGNLNTARYSHTATLLNNGKVLVEGGFTPGGNNDGSSELYDAANGTWTPTGNLNIAPRVYAPATLLANGKVLVAGGGSNGTGATASAELYDPANGTWTLTADLNAARKFHTATLLPNGNVLVAGGFLNPGTLASAELYTPSVDIVVDIDLGTIKKLSGADGTILWSVSVPNDGALAVDPLDLGVYTGFGNHTMSGPGTVYKYDASGTLAWTNSITVNSQCNFYYVSDAAVDVASASPGVVWTESGCFGGIAKSDRATGAQQWSDFTDDIGRASIDPANGEIYDVTNAGPNFNYDTLYITSADGTTVNSVPSCEGYTDLNPADGMLYRGGNTSSSGCGLILSQIDKSNPGSTNWDIDLSTYVTSFDALAVQPWSGGYIYVASAVDSTIVVVDPATQTVVRTFSTAIGANSIAVNPAGGTLYITDGSAHFVYAYSPTGSLVWISPDLGGAAGKVAAPRAEGGPALPPPTVTTNAATNVTGASATLNGTVNPNGLSTSVHFEYGTTTSYGSSTSSQNFSGNTTQPVSANISGLSPNTTYHFRLVGTSSGGTTFGSDITFTTLSPPIVTTTAATNVASSSATLNGTVNPNGLSTSVHFEYGTTTSYGSSTSSQNFSGNTMQTVSADISGLSPNTTYHFRLVGTNGGGTSLGTDMTFTTLGPPIVNTTAATNVTNSSATLNGTVNPNGLNTSVHFEYGTTTSYGSSTSSQNFSGNTTQAVSADISGLSPNTTYHFRLVGTSSGGMSLGIDMTFTTLGPPIVTTDAASNVASSSATLNGRVNPNGLSTSVHFEYGTTTSYGSSTSSQNFSGNTTQAVSADVSGLSPDTTYHFRLVGTNSAGTSVGYDVTFRYDTTGPIIVTNPATSVTSSSATLNGTVNPNGPTTSIYFEYGATASYGFTTTSQSYNGNTTQPVSADIPGLGPNTTYHFRLVGTNSGGTSFGNDVTFTTLVAPVPPVITSAGTATATVDHLFFYQVTATNGPTSYTAAPVPQGMTFDGASGILGGTPTDPGTTQIQLTASNSFGTGTATLTLTVQPAPGSGLMITSGTSVTARTGQPFSFQVSVTGASPEARLSATGLPSGLSLDPLTGVISGIPSVAHSLVTLRVTDGAITNTSTLQLTITSDPAVPVITSPRYAALVPGQLFSYRIVDSSQQSGTTFSLIGDLPPGLSFNPATGIISGTYNPRVFVNAGPMMTFGTGGSNRGRTGTSSVTLGSPVAGHAGNISTRLAVGTGDNVLIGGFIVTGTAPKEVIVRAIGPSLTALGVPGAMQDPTLELHNGTGAVIKTNDNWRSDPGAGQIQGYNLVPSDPRESATIVTLQPGNYTAIVRGANNTTGVALIEVYGLGVASLSTSGNAQLANISTRGLVQTGDNVMIGGFIVQGDMPATVIVRARGPSLANAGITNPLQDPTLELHNGTGAVIKTNDNWQSDPGVGQIEAYHLAPSDPRESATIVTLDPGNYTAIVRGANGTTGVALVEAYVLP